MKFLLLLLIIYSQFCYSQDLVEYGGLYIETPNFNDTSSHKYTIDNKIYRFNKKFKFDYYYKDPKGLKSKFLFKFDSIINPLGLINYNDSSAFKIDKFRMIITDELKHYSYNDSAYAWTVFNYEYLDNKDNKFNIEEFSSLVENYKNLFLVPPRHNIFDLLFLNPFPFVYTNSADRKWEWYLTIQPTKQYKSWLNFNEEFTLECKYSKKETKYIDTKFGKINCTKIIAKGRGNVNNKVIKTKSVFYYNDNYGFLKIENTLWNNSIFVIELIDKE